MWVAVVYTSKSKRKDGSLACFVHSKRGQAVTKAFKARREWQNKGWGPYDILVGRIDEQLEVSGDGTFLISDTRQFANLANVTPIPTRRIRVPK